MSDKIDFKVMPVESAQALTLKDLKEGFAPVPLGTQAEMEHVEAINLIEFPDGKKATELVINRQVTMPGGLVCYKFVWLKKHSSMLTHVDTYLKVEGKFSEYKGDPVPVDAARQRLAETYLKNYETI